MLDKKLVIDLEEENNSKENNTENSQEKEQNTNNIIQNNDFDINFNDEENNNNIKENDVDIDNNDDSNNEKNTYFGFSTNLLEEENKKEQENIEDLDLIKRITEKGIGVEKDIDKQVYEKVLSKYKSKSKIKYFIISFIVFLIVGTVGFLNYNNNIAFSNILQKTKHFITQQNIITQKNDSIKNIPTKNDNANAKDVDYELKYKKIKKEIILYFEKKLQDKLKNISEKDKKNIIFEFNVLKYEFNKNYINFKQFANQAMKFLK